MILALSTTKMLASIGAGLVLGFIIGFIINFLKKHLSAEQLTQLQKWLVYAVTEAEKLYGEKLGVLKLEYVFESFKAVFPKLTKKVTYDEFKEMVDVALATMKNLVNSNEKFKEYINQ